MDLRLADIVMKISICTLAGCYISISFLFDQVPVLLGHVAFRCFEIDSIVLERNLATVIFLFDQLGLSRIDARVHIVHHLLRLNVQSI